MSVTTMCSKNILQKKIFLPEFDSTVLLLAIPKGCIFKDVVQTTKQFIYSSIVNSYQFLHEYDIFLATESSIFDTKILLILYEALKYKNSCFIDILLKNTYKANVFECCLVTMYTVDRLYCQNLLESNRRLVCKGILNFRLIHKMLTTTCNLLWIYYRNCITDMFLTLKSNGTSNAYFNRNFCICNMEDANCNIEVHKFKIFSAIQAKHIQNYYNFENRLFQLLTHRKKYVYEPNIVLDSAVIYDNLLYRLDIYRNRDTWKALWNYYQNFFSTDPFTSRNFPKQATVSSKVPEKETADYIQHTVSKIRRKLKGTLYNSNGTNGVSKEDVNKSNSTSNDDKSQYKSMEVHKDLKKYWVKRYRLFSKFDEGIKLDYESWFSVTPEKIAIHIAAKCKSDIIIDAFCGAGGNSIQFANSCQQVLSIDIDLQKLLMARHNAKIYGMDGKIDFILGNFFCLAGDLIGDVVFLSPPWGGPKYVKKNVFDLKNVMEPYGGDKLLKTAQKITRNIAYYLPKNIDTSQLLRAAGTETRVEVEKNFLNDQVVAVTAYYGDLVDKTV